MTKRVLAILMCVLMILQEVTLAPVAPAGLYDNEDGAYEYAYFPVQGATAHGVTVLENGLMGLSLVRPTVITSTI